MLLVLGDSNPTHHIRRPWVNWALIATCVVLFFVNPSYSDYGLTPVELHKVALAPAEIELPSVLFTLVSYAFLHASLLHLGANMLVLWVFGDNIEDAMGHLRYLLFFILAGVAGGLTEALLGASPTIPIVGASGAIAGVMGAYLLLHPRARVLVLVLYRLPIVIPASVFVGLHVGFDLLEVLLPDEDPEILVAFWAHLGGFAAGIGLLLLLKCRDVPLFQPASRYPDRPFGRIGRFLIDLGHARDAGEGPVPMSRKVAFAVKTVLYLVGIVILVEMFLV